MSDDKPSKKPTVAALSAEVDTLTELVHQLTESVQRLNARITLMEQELDPQALEALRKQMEILSVAKPPDLRALSADEVREVIKVNPNAPLEVLADWKQAHYTFAAGAIVRCDHYPHMVGMVGAGLRVGIPEDREERIRQAREMAEASTRAAKASHAAAVAAKAEADARAALEA